MPLAREIKSEFFGSLRRAQSSTSAFFCSLFVYSRYFVPLPIITIQFHGSSVERKEGKAESRELMGYVTALASSGFGRSASTCGLSN